MTTKNKRYDLDTILTESQSLNTYDPNKKTRKGWTELSYATAALDQQQDRHGGNKLDVIDQKAFRLLSQHAFDAEGLMKEVNSMELKAQYDPIERLEGTDIEGYLLHHHEMIIFSAIDESRKIAEEDVIHIQRKWAADEWATSRRQLMDSLGHRSNIFSQSTAERHSHLPSHTPHPIPETPQSVGRDLSSIYLQTPRAPPTPFFPTPAADISQTPKGSTAVTPFVDKNSKPSKIPLEQSDLMRKYAEVVRLLRTNPDSSSQRTRSPSASLALQSHQGLTPATTLATHLESTSRSSLLADAKAVGMKESDLPAFRNLLQLFASMTGESEGQSRPPGYFSPVALDHPSLSVSSLSERRKILSSGSRSFLEKQFENMLVAKVDGSRASFSGRDDSSSAVLAGKNRLERIRMFTCLKTKSRQIPSSSLSCLDNPLAYGLIPPPRGIPRSNGDFYEGIAVWPQVYFCLRTGDLKDAHTLLKTCLDEGIHGIDEAAYVALGELIKVNQRGHENGSYRPHQISTVLSALSKCNALYRELANRSTDGTGGPGGGAGGGGQSEYGCLDPYRLQVLSLLGLADLDALCEGAYLTDTTVEDFLWTSLWFVHWTQLLSNAFTESTAAADFDDLPQAMPSFAQSKSYTAGFKSSSAGIGFSTPGPSSGFPSFSSPSRVASTGDRFTRSKFDLIDHSTQSPSANISNSSHRGHMTPSGIRRMHSDHLPKVYREGDIYLRVMDAGGADYFDPGMANPFTYSLILFCCLRFDEAISHLWHAGWTFPAIHLLVLSLHSGLVLPHRPLSSPGSSLSLESNDTTPASLLSLWISSKNAALDACQKADYLLSLNSQWVSFVRELETSTLDICRNQSEAALLKALESLICSLDRYDLSQLLGEESEATGIRISGYLDIYLDRELLQRVMAQTAYTLITSRRDLVRGIQLYELAGMFVEVLEELCNQLSLVALHSRPTGLSSGASSASGAGFWKEFCEQFYEKMNSETRGAVIGNCLQQEGRLHLRVLFETLLNLCVFVDLHADRRYQEALELLDNLKLLPSRSMSSSSGGSMRSSEDDGFTACIQRFSRLESPMKRLMDDVIVMAMDCIYGLYTTAKMEGGHGNGTSGAGGRETSDLLQLLRHRASVLITFVGYIQTSLVRPHETARKLSEVEVRMM